MVFSQYLSRRDEDIAMLIRIGAIVIKGTEQYWMVTIPGQWYSRDQSGIDTGH